MEEKIKIGDIEIGTQEAEQKIAKVNAMLDELNKKALKVKQSVDQNAVSNYTQSLPSNLTIQERFEKMHEFYAKPPKGVKLSYTEQDQSFLRYNQKMQDMYKNAEEKIKLALKLENESKSLNKFTELAQRQANSVDLPDYKKITKSAVLLMEDLQKQISEISALRNQISAYGLNISKMELFKGTQSVDLKSIKDKIKKDATKQITPFNNSNTSQNAVASKNIPTRKTSKINNAIYDVESSSMYELGEDYTTKKVKVGGQQRSQKNAKQAKGVTFSMSKGKKTIDTLMDYGDDSVNLSTLEEAVNIRSDKTGELIDSAKQLRERFNLAKEGIIKFSKEQQQSILKIYREQGMNADQLIKKIQEITGKSEIVGFNNANFDNQLMLEFAKTSKSSETQESYTKIFGNAKDVRKNVLQQLEKSGMKNSMYTGKTNLQDLLALVTGSKDSSAHNSQSDVASTQIVEEEALKQDNIFNKFGTIVSRITSKKNIEYDTKNVNSEYRKIINEVYDILLQKVQSGEVINIGKIVSSYLGEVQQPIVQETPSVVKKTKKAKPQVYTMPVKNYNGRILGVHDKNDEEIPYKEEYDKDYKGIKVGVQSAYTAKNGRQISEKNIFQIGNKAYEELSKEYTSIEEELSKENISSDKKKQLEDKKKEIEAAVVTAFCRSSEEAKEAFATQVQGTYGQERGQLSRTSKQDSYLDNYPLAKRMRALGVFKDYSFDWNLDNESPNFDYSDKGIAGQSKLTPEEQEEKYKKEDIDASVISTEEQAAAKEYLSSILTGLKSDKGFIGALKSGTPEIIEVIKTILSQGLGNVLGIDEDLQDYLDRLSIETNSGTSGGKLEPSQRYVGKNQAYLDEKEAKNVMTGEGLTEAEEEEKESAKLPEDERNKALGVVEVLKQGIISLIDEMEKEATPVIKEQLEAVKGKIGGLYSLDNNKEFKPLSVDEAQTFNRAASLLTYADTKDEAIKQAQEHLGINEESARDMVLSDENIKAKYDLSKKMSQVFSDKGGLEDIKKAWDAVMGIADKDILEISEQLSRLGKDFYPQFLENLKNQLTPNAESVNRLYMTDQAKKDIDYADKQKDIPEGLTPKQKTQRYYQNGLLTSMYGADFGDYDTAITNAQSMTGGNQEQIQKDIVLMKQLKAEKDGIVALDETDVKLQEQENQLIADTIQKISAKKIATGQGRKSAANIYNQAMLGLSSSGMSHLDEQLKNNLGKEDYKKLISRARKDRESQVEESHTAEVVEKAKEERRRQENKTTAINGGISQGSSIGNISIKNATIGIENANFKGIIGNVTGENSVKENEKVVAPISSISSQVTGIEGFVPTYDDAKHQYYKGGEPILSATQARDLLLQGKSSTFKTDSSSLKDKVASLKEGETLTAEKAGMSQGDYNFISGVNASGLKGDLFHHTIDAFVKNDVSSYEELEKKAPELFKTLEEEFIKVQETLQKYGISDNLTTKNDVKSYMEAIAKSGMTPTKFSEQQLGVTMHGNKGDISFGVTPDQLYSGELGAFVDNKTGLVKGYEGFQLTAQALGLKANSSLLKDENGKSLLVDRNGKEINTDNIELYIADVKDGTTQLIKYLALTEDNFYDLMLRAKGIYEGTAKPLEDSEKVRMNTQLKGDRIIGESPIENNSAIPLASKISDVDLLKYANKESSVIKSTDGKIYDSRTAVNDYIRADKELIKLDGERIALLLKQQRIQQEIEKLKIDGVDTSEKQQQLDKTRIDLENNDATRDREISAKNATNVEPAAKSGKLGKAEGLYKEYVLKMRPEYVSQSYEVGTQKGLENKASSNNSAIKEYLKTYKEILSVQGQIQVAQNKASTLSGQQKINQEAYIRSSEKRLGVLQSKLPIYKEDGGVNGLGTLGGADLTKEGRQKLIQGISEAQVEVEQKTSLANAQLKKQKGLLTQIGEGFKASFRNLVDYSLAYRIIGMIQQGFQSLITTTKELNTNMLNLRIVTGDSLSETQDLMKGYNNIAKEMGRTTQSVADASNDWLRAGYQGKEAIDLTRASLQLSTLGMIDSATATTDLISALKGWKLEAKDVSSVVDKLTVTTCGVCIVICIGHEFNCR